MRNSTVRFRFFLLLSAMWFLGPGAQLGTAADDRPVASCAQYMAPKRNVNGKPVGQEACQMQDQGLVDPDRKVHRVDIGVTGTLSGFIVKEGARSNHFSPAADFIFTQYGNLRPRFHGILRYEGAKGTSVALMYPETGWNGKVFVMVHGSSGSFLKGTLKPWDKWFDPSKPMADVTKYEKSLLAKGYAVARTKRNAERDAPGDYEAVLDNGEVWPGQNIELVPELILDEVRLVGNLLQDRLGRKPSRNYWYGHSGGAHLGLVLNYMQSMDPQLNRDADGKSTVDGFIVDDPGGGMFVPVLMRNGQDVLFRTPEDKAKFIKTIEVAHQNYPNYYSPETPWMMEIENIPKFVSPNYLVNKRTSARIFREKGLASKFRMYEVRGVSHSGGESLPDGKDGDVEILDLSRLMDGAFDLLDNWVEKGMEPPETKSDESGLSMAKNAVDLPETACPLGVYFPYPPLRGMGGAGSTGFAEFDGKSLEPVDGRQVPVDMNRNGRRDKRETLTEAWRRLGLLKPGETFSRAKYTECVQTSVARLRKENFITASVGDTYIREAGEKQLPAQ